MRKAALLLAVFVLTTAAYGDDLDATRVSILATDFSYARIGNDVDVESGVTVALSHRFGEKWGLEASYGFENDQSYVVEVREVSPGIFLRDAQRIGFRVHPLDVVGQFHIPTGGSRWKPYVGLGVRYTATPGRAIREGSYEETNPQLNLGAIVNLTPRLGIRFDGKALLRSNNAPWDESIKMGVGLSFRF